MKTRKEITEAVDAAMNKGVGESQAIVILLATQIELLADIRELLTYDETYRPSAKDYDRVADDVQKVREQG